MNTGSLAESVYFRLRLPSAWREVPLDPVALDEELPANSGYGDPDAAAATARQIGRLAEARQSGAVFVAGYARRTPDSRLGLILAELALVTRAVSGAATFEVLVAAVISRTTSILDRRLELPHHCSLGGIPALRDRRVTTVPQVEGAGTYELYECSYHFLFGGGTGAAAMAFGSPNIELAESLTDVFDAIAATLRLDAA